MLEVIGAGTSLSTTNVVDFSAFYNASTLNQLNVNEVSDLCSVAEDEDDSSAATVVGDHRCLPIIPFNHRNKVGVSSRSVPATTTEHTTIEKPSLALQLKLLTKRIFVSYWRTPAYNLVRFFINIIIALIFASAFSFQEYPTKVGAVSRSAVIFITCLFCGVVGMQTVLPVTFAERPAFYREQQSEMYSVALFTITTTLVEVMYQYHYEYI